MKKTSNNKILIWALASAICFVSCKKEEIPLYGNNRYVQFTSDIRDSIAFSFFYHPGKDEETIGIPVKLVGDLGSQDAGYRVEVLASESTASTSNYSLPAEQVFRKGVAKDTAWVTLKKTPDLDTKDVRLVLRITGSQELAPGQTDCTFKVIRITATVSKPLWWDANMNQYYMGRYSEKKFRTFMNVTGVGDLTPLNNSERLILMLQFKYYLIEQKANGTPVYMEDGADMLSTVPLLG
ncbi:MAG: DUF4843 domain-containing protein [Pseudobacter sp.]|uniref:DUF4843 domain-containing protein n=1 Tax=Pseudobacter sp. TaxID=2045420 RepID=UPI003F817855